MKVLLCEDIQKLGYFGDVVDVAEGYARNYLLPEGLAIVPTEDNLSSLADEKARRAEQRIKERERLESVAEKTKGAEAVIAAKANELGHLFGSVTVKDIAANLRAQGFEVADEVVKLREHIKQTGVYTVNLEFTDELTVPVTVTVVAEGQPIPVPDTPTEDSPKEEKASEDPSKEN
jgi:large subunit ribosomal protein L9